MTIAAGVLLKLVAIALDSGGWVAYVIAGAVTGLVVAKLFAEWARRLHDTGIPGLWGALIGIVTAAAMALLTVSSLREEVPWIMSLAWIAIGLILAVALLRPGASGENRFGPPPDGRFAVAMLAASASASRRGAIWAVVAAIGGALIGYAMIDISDGMRAAQERTRHYVEAESSR